MLASVTTRPVISGLRGVTVDPGLWEEIRVCPICRKADHLRDIGVVEADSLGGITAVCLDCEYGFLRRRPSTGWFDRFYSVQWDQRGQDFAHQHLLAPQPDRKVLAFCRPHLPPEASVLEIGAGFGSVLLAFREEGFNICALERSRHRAAFLNEVLGVPCIWGPVESTKMEDKFSLVYLNHVFEHVSDPTEVLGAISSCLLDGGMVYLAVPNLWLEYPPQAFHFVPHLWLFTLKSLTRLLAKFSFRIIKSTVVRDIQVLAVKSSVPEKDIGQADSVSRSSFWEKISHHVFQAFGGSPGDYTLVWNRSKGPSTYQSRIFPGARLTPKFLTMAFGARRVLPVGVWNRMAPRFLIDGHLRMLAVEVTGNMSLPAKVKHGEGTSHVWVK